MKFEGCLHLTPSTSFESILDALVLIKIRIYEINSSLEYQTYSSHLDSPTETP